MSRPNLSQLLCAILVICLFSNCRKTMDQQYFEDHPTADYKQCKIKTMYTVWASGLLPHCDTCPNEIFFSALLVFKYDLFGNPISIAPADSVVIPKASHITGRAALPYRIFRYDKYNRLTDYIAPVDPALSVDRGYEFWHKYGYDATGKATTDTIYTFGKTQNNRPAPGTPYGVRQLVYDSQNRLFPDIINQFYPPSYGNGYYYDTTGNLVGVDAFYTPYFNPLRTNKVWMFINKDYNVNVLDHMFFGEYNGCRLPNQYLNYSPEAYGDVSPYWWLLPVVQMKFTYECNCNCSTESTTAKNL